jgi:hypothetical protein
MELPQIFWVARHFNGAPSNKELRYGVSRTEVVLFLGCGRDCRKCHKAQGCQLYQPVLAISHFRLHD